ncbi:MAG: hypothetical protein U1F65_00110 [Verrucomicrobiota bacterium]
MNLNELQNTWNSPRNRLPSAEQEQLAQHFIRQMIRRRRFQAIWLTNTFVWLTLITVAVIQTIATGKFSLAREWAVIPLMLAPWIVAIYFLRRFLKSSDLVAGGDVPVADAFQVALKFNRTEQTHLKLVGALLALVIPLVVMAVQQLHAAGKVSAKDQTNMAVFFSVVLVVSGAMVAARYFRCVLPRQRKLNALLAEMSGPA